MRSLREKCNDVVLLTSKLIQNVTRVTQGLVRTARCLSSDGQSEILTEGGSCWERSDPQKRVKTRQRRGQLQRSLLPSLSAHTECGLHAYKAMEVWRAELLNCFDAGLQPLSAQLSVCHHLWKVGLLTITSLQPQIQWNPKKRIEKNSFYVVTFIKQALCIFLFISFCQQPSLSSWQTQGLCLVSGFAEIRCSEFQFLCPSLLFKSNSHISFTVFIVSSSIPLYQLQSGATQVLWFLYWRVRGAAVRSPTGSLSQQCQ